MKKRFPLLIFIVSLLVFSLESCSKQGVDGKNNSVNNSISNYIYSYTLNVFENQKGIQKNYIPEQMLYNLKRHVIKDGIFYSVFDLLYPGRINNQNTLQFYDLYNDDCNWVDSMLINLEEQRIANQIIEMENNLEDVIEPIDEEVEKTEAEEKENNIKEYIKNEVLTENRNLGYMEYGDERFIPQVIGENYILINSSADNVSRDFYDKIFRRYKSESWKINSSSEELLSTTKINYLKDTYIPTNKEIVTKDSKIIEKFNNKGQLIEKNDFALIEEKEVIKSSLKLKYNNDNKVRESNLTEYKYKDEKYSKLLYSFNKKYVYKYNKDDIPADFDYYENNVLKMRNNYLSNDTYTSKIFFDEGYSVTSYYQNNTKVKEIFYVKDVVERVKVYEQ